MSLRTTIVQTSNTDKHKAVIVDQVKDCTSFEVPCVIFPLFNTPGCSIISYHMYVLTSRARARLTVNKLPLLRGKKTIGRLSDNNFFPFPWLFVDFY